MTTRLLAVASVLCALTMASEASAQGVYEEQTTGLPARVRLTTTDGRRLSFDLLRVDAEGLVGRQAGRLAEPQRTVPFDQILRAERSLGRRRGRNALVGALVGGAIGAALLAMANSDASAEGCNVWSVCVPMFVLSPAALGAGVGAAVSPERWEPMSVGGRRIPVARGPGLKFTIRF